MPSRRIRAARGLGWGLLLGVSYALVDLVAAFAAVGWLFDPGVAGVVLIGFAVATATALGGALGAAVGLLIPPVFKARRLLGVGAALVPLVLTIGYMSRRGRNHELPPPSQEPTADVSPLLLVVVDTLRADTLYGDSYQYPFAPAVAEFARGAIRFDDAEATAGWTIPSMASMLTGVHNITYDASAGRLPGWGKTLAEHLRERGYVTHAVVDNVILEPRNGFAQGFQSFRQRSAFRFAFTFPAFRLWPIQVHEWLRGSLYSAYDGSTDVTDRAIEIVDDVAEGSNEALFLYVHYMDPHAPYYGHSDLEPAGGEPVNYYRFRDYLRQGIDRPPSPPQLRWLRERYEGEVQHWDRDFGRLLEAWRTRFGHKGVVVVVSDHGEEFLEHGRLGHGMTVHRETVHVPLIIELPREHPCHKEGYRPEPVSLLDLGPTLVDLATGREAQADPDGPSIQGLSWRSWLCEPDGRAPRRPMLSVHARHGRRVYRYRDGDDVYVQALYFDDPKRHDQARYVLGDDPHEQNNVWTANADDQQQYRSFSKLNHTLENAFDPEAPNDSEAVEESLRSLGYIQ